MVEGIQYGGGISSMRWKIFSTDVSHQEVRHQYSGGHAVWTCHIINTEEGVRYMAIKTAQSLVVAVFIWETDILQTI